MKAVVTSLGAMTHVSTTCGKPPPECLVPCCASPAPFPPPLVLCGASVFTGVSIGVGVYPAGDTSVLVQCQLEHTLRRRFVFKRALRNPSSGRGARRAEPMADDLVSTRQTHRGLPRCVCIGAWIQTAGRPQALLDRLGHSRLAIVVGMQAGRWPRKIPQERPEGIRLRSMFRPAGFGFGHDVQRSWDTQSDFLQRGRRVLGIVVFGGGWRFVRDAPSAPPFLRP